MHAKIATLQQQISSQAVLISRARAEVESEVTLAAEAGRRHSREEAAAERTRERTEEQTEWQLKIQEVSALAAAELQYCRAELDATRARLSEATATVERAKQAAGEQAAELNGQLAMVEQEAAMAAVVAEERHRAALGTKDEVFKTARADAHDAAPSCRLGFALLAVLLPHMYCTYSVQLYHNCTHWRARSRSPRRLLCDCYVIAM